MKIQELIDKHTERLKNMKENRAELTDSSSDEENNSMDAQIRLVAEFITDLKSVQTETIFTEAKDKFDETLKKL